MRFRKQFFFIAAIVLSAVSTPLYSAPAETSKQVAAKKSQDKKSTQKAVQKKKPSRPKMQGVNLNLVPDEGKDSLRIKFTLVNPVGLRFRIYGEKQEKPLQIQLGLGTQQARQSFKYGTRAYSDQSIPTVVYPNCIVYFRGLGISYYLLPWFHWGRGLYSKDEVLKKMPEWEKFYPGIDRKEFLFEIGYESKTDELIFFLDHQYAGRFQKSGKLKNVVITHGNAPKISSESFQYADSPYTMLHPRGTMHSSTLLQKDAELSIPAGKQDVAGIPMIVYSPAESMDSGIHKLKSFGQDFGYNAFRKRHAFVGGPEFLNFGVQRRFYSQAYVLCADIPQKNRVPVLGTVLTRFGNLNSQMQAEDKADLQELLAQKDSSVKQVGTLTYREGGNKKTTPLYLVKHSINFGRILEIMNDKPFLKNNKYLGRELPQVHDYLDFEFVGAGSAGIFPRSSIQIFGCTLVESPYQIDMVHTERGNIFHNDEKPETGLELTAREANVKGSVRCDIFDHDFKPVKSELIRFTLKEANKPEIIKVPLSMKNKGWYGLNFSFFDEKGSSIACHEGAFGLLGKNTREAGFESPYSAWPHGNGGHNNNPNNAEVAKLMFKAGYHSVWAGHLPAESEKEFSEYKLTWSQWCFNHRKYYTPEELQKYLDKGVEDFRELRKRFPHCKAILLLHETGGKGLAQEMLNRKAERGPYLAEKGNNLVYFCTEVAKRMRKEFPNCDIILGNGSSSSEKIAELARNGFDLNLVHRLGIESKGFQTMPELNSNLEAPGMAWALRETGRRFGYDIPVDVCNEYVFRPERNLTPKSNYMQVTDFSLRDYLISLGHGMRYISTGHLEDSGTPYYDYNWGAGGQCKFYPYSYPKRLFVALATLTKVFDKPQYSRRLPTGELSTYALEFKRNRKIKDYAYAFWTPKYDVDLAVTFPQGAKVTEVHAFGVEKELSQDADGKVKTSCGSTPRYLISNIPATGASVLKHSQWDIQGEVTTLRKIRSADVTLFKNYGLGTINPVPGNFELSDVQDSQKGTVVEAKLIPGKTKLPEVVWEYQYLKFNKPVSLDLKKTDELGLWVKGNSSFGKLFFVYMDENKRTYWQQVGYRGYLCFDGWHLTKVKPEFRLRNQVVKDAKIKLIGFYFGSARLALDPLEMRPVTTELRFGDVVSIKKSSTEEKVNPDKEFENIMKTVDQKDL